MKDEHIDAPDLFESHGKRLKPRQIGRVSVGTTFCRGAPVCAPRFFEPYPENFGADTSVRPYRDLLYGRTHRSDHTEMCFMGGHIGPTPQGVALWADTWVRPYRHLRRGQIPWCAPTGFRGKTDTIFCHRGTLGPVF